MNFEIFNTIEEQALIGFTGKINLLSRRSSAFIGNIYILDGSVINARMGDMPARKSFINLCIESHVNTDIKIIVEPERLSLVNKKLDIPFSVLKRKILEIYDEYIAAKKNKPPENLKILTKVEFLDSSESISTSEFSLLLTLSDYSNIKDIYANNELLEYEITNTLMSLRKKNAIKIIEVK